MKIEQEVKPVRRKVSAPGTGEETISAENETEGQTRDPVGTPDSDPHLQRVGREAPRVLGSGLGLARERRFERGLHSDPGCYLNP